MIRVKVYYIFVYLIIFQTSNMNENMNDICLIFWIWKRLLPYVTYTHTCTCIWVDEYMESKVGNDGVLGLFCAHCLG